MAELKTQATKASVEDFLNSIEPAQKRADAQAVDSLMQAASGHPPQMWGKSIVGYGQYHYRYASGREGDWMEVGFSPRKQALTLYIMSGFAGEEDLLARLGKHRTGKSCLYINKLADVDETVLRELIERSIAEIRARHPTS